MTVRIKITVLSLRQKATRDDRMGLVKTRRLMAMHPPSPRLRMTGRQQRAKAGMKMPVMKCGAKKEDDSFRSRNGRKTAEHL